MYAIVKTGGKQYKVAVGDVVQVEKVAGGAGDAVALPALLVVDGATVTTDADGARRRHGHRRGRRPHQGPEDQHHAATRTRPATSAAWATASR